MLPHESRGGRLELLDETLEGMNKSIVSSEKRAREGKVERERERESERERERERDVPSLPTTGTSPGANSEIILRILISSLSNFNPASETNSTWCVESSSCA